jgi:hypothetical protein
MLVNPASAQRIDVVKRFEFAVGVPPAGRQFLKFGDFISVDVVI